jgi:uncharacterized membrane-anchored protein
MKTRYLIAATLTVCLVQSTALAHMVYDRMTLLRDGREVTLKTTPIDPRSLFRGHYVRLNYNISRVNKTEWKGQSEFTKLRGKTIYVEVTPTENGNAVVVAAHDTLPWPAAGNIVMRANVKSTYSDRLFVRYGLERLYAPKSRAKALETDYARQAVQVVAAVDPATGEAAIKALIVKGKRVYEERWY